MIDLNDYRNEKGMLTRSKIVEGIMQHKITKADIHDICIIPEVKSLYINKTFGDKEDNTHWNESYLLTLSAMGVAGAFNEEYMLHVADVVEYLDREPNKPHNNHLALTVLLGVLIIILGGIVLSIVFYSDSH